MKKTMIMLSLVMAIVLSGSSVFADATFVITEVYTGISNEDGTQDWIEVTNIGDMFGDTGDLLYDDSNPSVGNSGMLDSIILGVGQSAVFLLDDSPIDDVAFTTAIEEFQSIWNYSGPIGLTNGGGNLGQGSDVANIGTDMGGVFDVVDSLSYDAALAGEFATINDPTGTGTPALSVLGANGAYQSQPFFNDGAGGNITLIGSPGTVVPEPAAAAVLAIGLVAFGLRRRK